MLREPKPPLRDAPPFIFSPRREITELKAPKKCLIARSVENLVRINAVSYATEFSSLRSTGVFNATLFSFFCRVPAIFNNISRFATSPLSLILARGYCCLTLS